MVLKEMYTVCYHVERMLNYIYVRTFFVDQKRLKYDVVTLYMR